MLKKVLNYFQEQGYHQNSKIKEWQINKTFDLIVSKDGNQKQFDRSLTEQIFRHTKVKEFDKVILRQFLSNMERQDKLKYLFPVSFIYGSNTSNHVQQSQNVESQKISQQISQLSQKNNQQVQMPKPSDVRGVEIQQYSQRQSFEPTNQNAQSISRPLNATLNASIQPSSSLITDSFIFNQTPGGPQPYVTPKGDQPIAKSNQSKISQNLTNTISTQIKASHVNPALKTINNDLNNDPSSIITIQDNQLNMPLLCQKSQQQRQEQIYRSLQSSRPPLKNKSIIRPPATKQNDRKSYKQQIDADDNQKNKKKKCLAKIWYIPMCIFIFGCIVFACSFIIHSLLISKAIDQVILKPQNEGIWAHFPGDTKTQIFRNWTFFNITNADDMMFYNAKPKFREISGYKIQQLEDYINITYIQEGDRVQMIDWLHFKNVPDSRNLQQKVKVLNVGGLAYWYNLKISRPTIILQQGLGLLFNTLQQSIIENIYAQAINVQFLNSYDNAFSQLFSPADISINQSMFIWNDTAYGLSNQNNLKYWIEAVRTQSDLQKQINNPGYIFLLNYFTLQRSQLQIILSKFQIYIQFITQSVLKNNYCPQVRQCTGRYLSYKQFTNSYVTNNPPKSHPPIAATQSICQSNSTCKGYFPQIEAYYKKIYIFRYPQRNNQTLQFDPQWMKNLVNYNISIQKGYNYSTAQNSLFHIGNLDALWNNGTLYDQSIRKNNQKNKLLNDQAFRSNLIPNPYLQNIKVRFGLPSLNHTMVFWQWIKYLTNQLILRNQTNQKLGVANLFSQGLYKGFTYIQDNLQDYLLLQLISLDVKNSTDVGNCTTFLGQSFGISDNITLQYICNTYGQKISKKLVKELMNICKNISGTEWHLFITKYNLRSLNFDNLCDPSQQESITFGNLLYKRRVSLNKKYNCSKTPKQYCSDYELAAIQWKQSKVTLQPPEQLNILPNKYYSYSQWDSKAQRFEYGFFKSKYKDQQFPFPDISIQEAYGLLNFDNWFSASVSLKQFVDPQVNQKFKSYMRFVAIQAGLNGLTMEKTPNQLIFGYKDQILQNVKNSYIPFGGDPSTPSLIAFNDPNITQKQATMTLQWNTGLKNSYLASQYRKINGLPYLTVPKDSFNGNITRTQLLSPWIGQDYFYGTSAKMFAPDQFDQANISLYVPNIQRYGSGVLNGQQQNRFGFDVQVAYLGEYIYQSTQQSQTNKKYYQTFRAIFNQTSVVGFPLYVCKNHFMNVSSNWSDLVEIYNEDETIKYQAISKYDDSFVVVEPYTGVSFQSTIFLQSNYYHAPDSLLTFYNESLLPIFSLWRSGNITQQVANDLFGPLAFGLSLVKWTKIVGIIIVGLACILVGVIYYKKRLARKKGLQNNQEQTENIENSTKSSQLGISLQPISGQGKQKQMIRQQSRKSQISDHYIPPPSIVEQQI